MSQSYLGNLPVFDHKSTEWVIFKSRLTKFFLVNGVTELVKKSAIVITHLSDETYRLVHNLAYPKEIDALTYDELVELLDDHFKRRECTFADKAKFHGATMSAGESLSEWVARLRGLASYCDFGSALETNLKDRFVLGLGSGPVRDKLFERKPSSLTLATALELAQQTESAREAKAAIKEEPVFRAQMEGGYRGAASSGSRGRAGAGGGGGRRDPRSTHGQVGQCAVCGLKNHSEDDCRYKSYKCKKCGKKGHLKKVCGESARVFNVAVQGDNIASREMDECEECRMFNLRYVISKPIMLNVLIDTREFQMELDSGSGTSVISGQLYRSMFSEYKLFDSEIRMCLYDGHKIEPLGYFTCDLTYNGTTRPLRFFVVHNGGPPLLGRDFMSAFNLKLSTKLNNISTNEEVKTLLEQYSQLWQDELGTFNKLKVNLQLKPNSVPKFFKPRTVPFALKEKVECELDRLVSLGILVPVSCSQYATPIVPVLKENGKVRIAGDFSVTLNKDLIIDKYPLPKIEEVFAKLGGGEHYSKIDLKNAYNQFVLSDESQELTTINTQKGLYKYTRLVYGLANAPAIFQKSMEMLLQGVDGVSCWLDDICITGVNKERHLKSLKEVLHRLNDAGLRLQQEKCEFFKDSVTYLGYTISKSGLQTCPAKVKAILESPDPTNVTEVKRFVGMINYYRNFIPNASSILRPLYDLLGAKAEWEWGPRQREAARHIKRELASERLLAHFDPSAQLVLGVDAGPSGLGAVLSQRDVNDVERPLAFASRSLSASEKNYSQIQKEATAIIFGVKKFHQYLYGRSDPFILKTDHRPLLSIFNNKTGISMTSALRLQRYAIILSAYNYNVQFISGEKNVVADYFSRAPLSDTGLCNDNEYDTLTSINFLNSCSPAVLQKEVQEATESDKILQTVIRYMNRGWPRKINCASMLPYFRIRVDLQFENGCLLRGHKVIIPESLRNRLLDELHSSHLGIVKMKSNARSRMWWPGIDNDIERRAGACETCAAIRPAPARAPPAAWPHPIAPFQRVHIDYMSIGHRTYLILVDAFSKWIECWHMDNGTATKGLIGKLKQIFSHFGIPNLLVSDNDVKINSAEFREFCSSNGIKYMTSPIYHPCSNGQAEISVKLCKKILKCILKENLPLQKVHEVLQDYLFSYRNTVHSTTGATPAKLMFGRELRTRLDLLLPKDNAQTMALQDAPRAHREFNAGDLVWVRWYVDRKESWVKGKVLDSVGRRMYKIFVLDYNTDCIRHVDQIFKRHAQEQSLELSSDLSSAQSRPLPTTAPPAVTELEPISIGENESIENGEKWGDCEEAEMESERERPDVEPVEASLQPEAPPQPEVSARPDDAADQHEGLPLARQGLRPRINIDFKKYF